MFVAILLSKPVVAVIGIGIGFAVGRIKNAKKLQAIQAEIDKVEATAGAEAQKVITAIRMKL